MKKIFYISLGALLVILAYMLAVWFFVPAEAYTDLFATEKIMREMAALSPFDFVRVLFYTQLAVTTLFFCISLFLILFKKLKSKFVLIFSLLLPTLCSLLLDVFLIKPILIGFAGDSYSAQTIMQTTAGFDFNITMFDVLFSLCIGLVTTLVLCWVLPEPQKDDAQI